MWQRQRERLLTFVISVILCCMMSASLSLIAKKSRDKSAVSSRTARLATPDDVSTGLSDGSQNASERAAVSEEMLDIDEFINDSMEEEMDGSLRASQPIGGSFMTAAILCLGAAMCCAITAVGALLLLRGPRGRNVSQSEEEDSDEYMGLKARKQSKTEETCKRKWDAHGLVRDEIDEISPEEAV